ESEGRVLPAETVRDRGRGAGILKPLAVGDDLVLVLALRQREGPGVEARLGRPRQHPARGRAHARRPAVEASRHVHRLVRHPLRVEHEGLLRTLVCLARPALALLVVAALRLYFAGGAALARPGLGDPEDVLDGGSVLACGE